jgi:hypothetical protein
VKLRFALAGLVVLSASLAACSSGTSCGFGCPPTTGPTTEPSPLNLIGTQTQDFTYYYGFPSPEPPSKITTQIAQKITVAPTALASPFPPGSANDVHVDETDNLDGLQTISLTGDSFTATSSGNVLLYGSIENTPATGNGQSTIDTLVYAAPQIVDKSPETNNAAWTNKPGAQLTEVYGDGHSENRTIADDGTYAEIGYAQSPDGAGYIPIHLTELASGAGSYDGPFFGLSNLDNDINAPSGNPPTISATYQIRGKATKPLFTIPAWFSTPPKLFAEADSILTGVKLPAGCNHAVNSAPVNEVIHNVTGLDTIIGYTERSERDSYAESGAVVCVVFSDTLENFYDWNGDTPPTLIVYVSKNKKKISEVVTTELLTLPASVTASAQGRREPRGVAGAIPAFAVGALQDRFNAKIETTKRAILQHDKKRGAR